MFGGHFSKFGIRYPSSGKRNDLRLDVFISSKDGT